MSFFFFSSRRRHTRYIGDWSSDVCSSDLAVNGSATGLGCDIALCCDFIVASTAATFAMSYIHRGLIPDGGGLYFLPRRVGLPRAKELIFTGRRVDPDEALRIGMIDRVTAPEALLAEARGWAAELSHGSAAALALG